MTARRIGFGFIAALLGALIVLMAFPINVHAVPGLALGPWTTDPPDDFPGSERGGIPAVTAGGFIYWVGGDTPDDRKDLWRYDPVTDSWLQLASMAVERWQLGAAHVGGKIYAIGGSAGPIHSSAEVYDISSDTWTPIPDMPGGPRERIGVAALGGMIYVAGGSTGGLDRFEVFDPASSSWTTLTPMPTARFSLRLVPLQGKLYAIGGFRTGTGILSTVEVYDPATDTWSTAAPMNVGREESGAAAIAGVIVVTGGGDGAAPVSSVEIYDPTTDTWTLSEEPMLEARQGHGFAAIGNKVYAIAGPPQTRSIETATLEPGGRRGR